MSMIKINVKISQPLTQSPEPSANHEVDTCQLKENSGKSGTIEIRDLRSFTVLVGIISVNALIKGAL